MALGRRDRARDPAEAVALVAAARRTLLLRVHRRRLLREDLEDAYSQATLELVTRARRAPFQSHAHIANALEQKFVSRIDDRRRAISGRSAIETALAGAVPVDEPGGAAGEIEDRGAEVLQRVAGRLELGRIRELIGDLSGDQKLVLASQVTWDMECAEFCSRYGWSPEKYRKVAQRARARLRVLINAHDSGERCRSLQPEIAAYAAGVLSPERSERLMRHLESCRSCARELQDLEVASRRVAALLPPALGSSGALAKLAIVLGAARRFGPFAARRVAHAAPTANPGPVAAGAGGSVFGAGGSVLGAGLAKLGAAAACVAVATGGLVICVHHGRSKPTRQVDARLASRVRSPAIASSTIAAGTIRSAVAARPRSTTPARISHPPASSFLKGRAADAQARREFGAVQPLAAAAGPRRALQRGSSANASPTGSGEFGFER